MTEKYMKNLFSSNFKIHIQNYVILPVAINYVYNFLSKFAYTILI